MDPSLEKIDDVIFRTNAEPSTLEAMTKHKSPRRANEHPFEFVKDFRRRVGVIRRPSRMVLVLVTKVWTRRDRGLEI
jgi:hypothetical protein